MHHLMGRKQFHTLDYLPNCTPLEKMVRLLPPSAESRGKNLINHVANTQLNNSQMQMVPGEITYISIFSQLI